MSERAAHAEERPGRIEAHSIDVVPASERHGQPSSLGSVWFVETR